MAMSNLEGLKHCETMFRVDSQDFDASLVKAVV